MSYFPDSSLLTLRLLINLSFEPPKDSKPVTLIMSRRCMREECSSRKPTKYLFIYYRTSLHCQHGIDLCFKLPQILSQFIFKKHICHYFPLSVFFYWQLVKEMMILPRKSHLRHRLLEAGNRCF